jgi:hypothetical protein
LTEETSSSLSIRRLSGRPLCLAHAGLASVRAVGTLGTGHA